MSNITDALGLRDTPRLHLSFCLSLSPSQGTHAYIENKYYNKHTQVFHL